MFNKKVFYILITFWIVVGFFSSCRQDAVGADSVNKRTAGKQELEVEKIVIFSADESSFIGDGDDDAQFIEKDNVEFSVVVKGVNLNDKTAQLKVKFNGVEKYPAIFNNGLSTKPLTFKLPSAGKYEVELIAKGEPLDTKNIVVFKKPEITSITLKSISDFTSSNFPSKGSYNGIRSPDVKSPSYTKAYCVTSDDKIEKFSITLTGNNLNSDGLTVRALFMDRKTDFKIEENGTASLPLELPFEKAGGAHELCIDIFAGEAAEPIAKYREVIEVIADADDTDFVVKVMGYPAGVYNVLLKDYTHIDYCYTIPHSKIVKISDTDYITPPLPPKMTTMLAVEVKTVNTEAQVKVNIGSDPYGLGMPLNDGVFMKGKCIAVVPFGAGFLTLDKSHYQVPITVRTPTGKQKNYKLIITKGVYSKSSPVWIYPGSLTEPVLIDFDSDNTGYFYIDESIKNIPLKIEAKKPDFFVGIGKEPEERIDNKVVNLSGDETVVDFKVKKGIKDYKNEEITSDEYKLKFVYYAKNCSLKDLKIDKALNFKFSPNIYDYVDVPLPLNDNIKITAVPADNKASVYIDDVLLDSSNSRTIQITDAANIKIRVANGKNESIYTIGAIPALAISGGNYDKADLEITVLDSLGGTYVDGTTLKIYKSGDSLQIGSDIPIVNGKANVQLTANARYDFELIGQKKKWAGSRLENYFIDANPKQQLIMYQFVHNQHPCDVKPPKVLSWKAATTGGIRDIFDGLTINSKGGFTVQMLSPSAAIYPVDQGGFGIKLGFGVMPTSLVGIHPAKTGNDSDYDIKFSKEPDGSFKQTFNFDFSNKKTVGSDMLTSGQNDIILVAYDAAGNRLQKHYRVTIDMKYEGRSLEDVNIVDLFVITQRTPTSLNAFSAGGGLAPVDGTATSYKVQVQFVVVDQNNLLVPISGFDVLRRRSGSNDPFVRTSGTYYGLPTPGSIDDRGYPNLDGLHMCTDSDYDLEENGEYDYKVRIYNGNYSKETQILHAKIMESFSYELTAPSAYAVIDYKDAHKQEYGCKISNPNLLDGKNADFISFGLLINAKNGAVHFASRCNYFFDLGGEGPDIRIFTTKGQGRKSVRAMIKDGTLAPYGVRTIDDLIAVNKLTGEIKFTDKFVKVGFFNTGGELGKPLTYEKGCAYQWNILNWGTRSYSANDDNPMMIIKYWTDEYGSGMESRAYGSTSWNENSAKNGKLEFFVK